MTTPRVQAAVELDASTAPRMLRDLLSAIEGHPGSTIVVDLSPVEFLDSSALSVLVTARKRARQDNGDIALTGASPRIWRLFTITGLDRLFSTTPPD